MAPLTVDPAALDGAGSAVITVGEGLAAAITGLGTALAGSGGMAGNDPAGIEVGRSYDSSASKVVEAMATTRNGLSRLGDGVRMSAHNYSLAEAHSDLSGRGNALSAAPMTAPVSAHSPPSSVGAGTNAPPGWAWVAPYIGMIWPTGDSAKMRVAAAAWLTAGTNFGVTEIQGTGGVLGPIRAQQIPEGGMIDAAFTDAYESTTRVVGSCQRIADQLNAYADKVDKVHAAILDLLSRICNPLTGLKEVWEFLTGEDEDEIKKIARDIRTVVENFTAEVQALGREIGKVLTDSEHVVATMSKHAAKEWDQFLHGTEVGRQLNQVGQLCKGVGEEAWDMGADSLRYGLPRAVVDPLGFYHDWGQRLEDLAPLVGQGGDGAPSAGQAWKDFGKGIVHWDDWSKNPAEAAGKSLFDVVSAVVGGKGMSEIGKALRVPHDFKPPEVHTDSKLHPTENSLKPETASPSGGKAGPAPDSTNPKPETAAPRPSGKPEPAPPGSAAPHSPSESKPPATGMPGAGEPPKSPVESAPPKSGEPIGRPGDAPPAGGQHPQPVQAPESPHPSTSFGPHSSRPESALMHAGELLKSPTVDGGLHDPGHGGEPAESHSPTDGSAGGHDHERSNNEPPHGLDFSHESPIPEQKMPGIDYPYSPSEALAVLEHPGAEVSRLAEGGVPPSVLKGYEPLAGRTLQEFEKDFTIPGRDGKPRWDWDNQAPNNGFAATPEPTNHIPEGFRLDRVGPNGGAYLSPEGAPLVERATPPGLASQYHVYESTGEPVPPDKRWVVLHGAAKEAFGQAGGGQQWVIIDQSTGNEAPVTDLIKAQMLREVKPAQ